MIKPNISLLSAAAVLGVVAGARVASAQVDVNQPLPNVMLLVDTSGSMEYKSSGTDFPQCDPLVQTSNQKSRWIELVEVLTGTIQDYRCDPVDRSSADFRTEYTLGTTIPADYQYLNRHYRPMSGNCVIGPGTLNPNVFEFPSSALRFHPYNNLLGSCTNFQQDADGVLDAYSTGVRFGLMTFDADPDPGIGYSGTTTADFPGGVKGQWSYFLPNQPAMGMPAGCAAAYPQEVGARNAAAPPWEGRMVAFGDQAGSASVLSSKNQQIQQILLSTRPYGATPIAGMLDDAAKFFRNDGTTDPLTGLPFGPKDDPYVLDGCRTNHIILLTDGEPNLDLRPHCEATGGQCPYQKPEKTAWDLATLDPEEARIKTSVVGFALSQVTLEDGTPFDCRSKAAELTSPTGVCAENPNARALQACCTLHRIAYNGGTGKAYFADNMTELRAALNEIVAPLRPAASRTTPVFAAASNLNSVNGGSYRFLASFFPQALGLWTGSLKRQRWVCEPQPGEITPEPKPFELSEGDDFVHNVNSDPSPTTNRRIISVTAEPSDGAIRSTRSIRPNLDTTLDGLGNIGGEQYNRSPDVFPGATNPLAMGITGSTCTGLDANSCTNRIMGWTVGGPSGDPDVRDRCPSAGNCNLIGDIYHSTPTIVGPPSAFLRDETYDTFAAQNASRPNVLYTSTNDGFLHAFDIDVENDDASNELWAFIPPGVLPRLVTQYGGAHQQLLDGVPVVKDVVAKAVEGSPGEFTFERSVNDARGIANTWRTVLIQSFGTGQPGYFAIDVTDPTKPAVGSNATGPRFLWQLTTDENNNPLFGKGGATPLITTVLLNDADAETTKEVAVAVLPGGGGPAPTAGAEDCGERETGSLPAIVGFTPRSKVNCYETLRESRSLTLVRLDSGEVLRTFRKDAAEAPSGLVDDLVTPVPNLLSPITGQPVAFPAQPGAVADRVFVGDADGTLWRVDLASPDPEDWTMEIFFDGFPSELGHQFNHGQPIMVPPVLSVERTGLVTIAFATGDQELFSAPEGQVNYVWSLTEEPNANVTKLVARVNWYLGGDAGVETALTNGERVAGPMSLFNEVLYFSTYKPPESNATNVCSTGSSRVWGVHYVDKETATSPTLSGGKAQLDRNANQGSPDLVQFISSVEDATLIPEGSVIFGVGVAQIPSCFETVSGDALIDPYSGGGAAGAAGAAGAGGTGASGGAGGAGSGKRTVKNITAGKFQLVMQSRGTQIAIDLASPSPVSRIDSWAAIVE